jgi:hypothetical protein
MKRVLSPAQAVASVWQQLNNLREKGINLHW